MTAKEYLRKIKKLDEMIGIHIEELNKLRTQAESLRSPGFEEHYGGTRPGDAPFVSSLEAIIVLEDQISQEIANLTNLRTDARKRIADLPEPKERMLLQYRYLHDMSWKEIMDVMVLSETSVHRIHQSALQHFKAPH